MRTERRGLLAAGGAYAVATALAGTLGPRTALAAAGADPDHAAGALVAAGAHGWGFVASGQPWPAFGINWLDPDTGSWPPHQWSGFKAARVDRQFGRIAALGIRAVRIFVAATFFQPTPTLVRAEALRRMEQYLGLAERHGLRVLFTGPDHWEGVPAYWGTDPFAEPEALRALETYWTVIGRHFGADPRILAWDLRNEPHIGWASPPMAAAWPAWLRQRYGSVSALRHAWGQAAVVLGDTFELIQPPPDAPFPGDPVLLDYQLFREAVAERWITVQQRALRAAGDRHLHTVGLLQWSVPLYLASDRPSQYSGFDPTRVGRSLDLLSIHFYTMFRNNRVGADPQAWVSVNRRYLEAVLAYILQVDPVAPGSRAASAALRWRPLILEEFGWGAGGSAGAQWIAAVMEATPRWCCGWFPWTYRTPAAHGDWGLFLPSAGLSAMGQAYGAARAQVLRAAAGQRPPAIPRPWRPPARAMLTAPSPGWLNAFIQHQGIG